MKKRCIIILKSLKMQYDTNNVPAPMSYIAYAYVKYL